MAKLSNYCSRVLIPSFGLLFGALTVQAQENAVYQISETSNPRIMSRALGNVSAEDNKTYMAFDSDDNLYYFDFRDKGTYGFLVKEKDGVAQKIDLMPAIKQLLPTSLMPDDTLGHAFGSLQIDNKNRIYIIYYVFDPHGEGRTKWKGRIPILLYSLDRGQHFTGLRIPGNPDLVLLEDRNHATTADWPPILGCTKETTEFVSKMANRNSFDIVIPRLEGNTVVLGDPITITDNNPGISSHTGGMTFASTFGDVTYVAYNEIPDNKQGNNIMMARVNRKDGSVEDKMFVTHLVKPTYPDIHITPLVVVDKNGNLSLITDGDGDAFGHFMADANQRTLRWKNVASLPGARIYSNLIIDGSGRLHLLFTEWSHAPKACYQTFDPQTMQWSNPVTLLIPPTDFSANSKDNYGIYYYKACIDRQDNLYVSFTFWESYNPSHLYPRKVMEKKAGQESWSLLPE
jgi:hypothetical protein